MTRINTVFSYSTLKTVFIRVIRAYFFRLFFCYARKEISTPAATAEPITPDILLAIQYCNT